AGGPAIGGGWIAEHLADGKAVLKVITKIVRRTRTRPEDAYDVRHLDLRQLTPEIWGRLEVANDPPRLFAQGGSPVRIVEVEIKNDHWQSVVQPLTQDRL